MEKSLYAQLVELDDTLSRLENERDKLREKIIFDMVADGVDQSRQEGFVFSLSANKPKLDMDRKQVPPDYMVSKMVPDEAKIRKELDEGKLLGWVALDDSKPFKLTVRFDTTQRGQL